MRAGRFKSIGLLLSTESARSSFPSRLFDGIYAELADAGMRLTLSKLADATLASAGAMPQLLEELCVDGLLINYTHSFPAKMEDLIRQYVLPSVWINSRHNADCVYPDDCDAGWQATEALLGQGHRRIAYVASVNQTHYSTGERLRGYRAAMTQAGLRPTVFSVEGDTLITDERARFCRSLLSQPDRPTACVSYGLDDAMTLLCMGKDLGLSVPRDLSLVTFGDTASGGAGVVMTTALVPEHAVGQRAAEMLIAKIEAPEIPLDPSVIAYTIKRGGTVAPPAM